MSKDPAFTAALTNYARNANVWHKVCCAHAGEYKTLTGRDAPPTRAELYALARTHGYNAEYDECDEEEMLRLLVVKAREQKATNQSQPTRSRVSDDYWMELGGYCKSIESSIDLIGLDAAASETSKLAAYRNQLQKAWDRASHGGGIENLPPELPEISDKQSAIRALSFLFFWVKEQQKRTAPPATSDPPTTAQSESARSNQANKKRGRKLDTDPKADERIADAWETGQHKDYEALAAAIGKRKHEVKCAIDRVRQRKKAKKQAPE